MDKILSVIGAKIRINGVVQGVGFRPFVYGLATRLALTGWVRNTSAGVEIEVNGPDEALQAFAIGLQHDAPPLARIDQFEMEICPVDGYTQFEILHSEPIPGAFQPISPDVSICPDCLKEILDPGDRRYRYPFTNCTNCGPRFTIITDIPYDRPKTTMAGFPMCPGCSAEYSDPFNRRFHAQPVACPVCGPQVWLEKSGDPIPLQRGDDAILSAQRQLLDGKILAIKGLGGFHLACDATQPAAVQRLRERKLRVDKPFAVMMPDLQTVERHCLVSAEERAQLLSRERPIVLLQRRVDSEVARSVAPNQDRLGVMLPYTPLHYLLFAQAGACAATPFLPLVLVMTSGNLSEEPIATGNDEARQRLGDLVDGFLLHDRPIHTRCDDSVVQVVSFSKGTSDEKEQLYPVRRSRGYAPYPVLLPWETPPLLATGAELKNTFCLGRDRYAFLSHHIGDMENYETLRSFEEGVTHFERLFRIQPEVLAYDMHPNYLASRYALERAEREGLPVIGVQHHHAHIAACMVDHHLPPEQHVIGVSFDGTGYGEDGAIWGGEFMIAGYAGYERKAHLAYLPLPGGDRAIREPWRVALAALFQAGISWSEDLPPVQYGRRHAPIDNALNVLTHQLQRQMNTPPTSSIGRLFDAAAAIAGVRQVVNYEAQAAIEFEALLDPQESGAYSFDLHPVTPGEPLLVDPAPLLTALVSDRLAGIPLPVMSARFHRGVAGMVADVCLRLHNETGINVVAISGGVWQNLALLRLVTSLLEEAGLCVLIHQRVPTNDGGLALGQAAIAAQQLLHI